MVVFLTVPVLLSRRHREKPEPKVQIEMRSLLGALRHYEADYDKYPSGDSPEILQALLGSNPRMIVLLTIPPRSTNNAGQFVDPWGTPYEIAFESTNHVTIRSAGNNRTFGDKDDVTMSTSRR
jgi:hypothetical protein